MPPSTSAMNAAEAAALLGAHVETVRRLARRGEIPCFKLGKDWRFHREAIERWSHEQRSHQACRSVLIVDDEFETCRAIGRIVRLLGHRALLSTDAKLGLELVAHEAPDLLMLDLMMPGMNGPQFLRELRKTHPDLPVVIVTGYTDGQLIHEAALYGPLMVLAKPFGAQQIERTIRSVVGEKALAQRHT
jgi:two-component system, response regulator, stage 0 sporulation protein F